MDTTTGTRFRATRHPNTAAKRRKPRDDTPDRVEDDYYRLNRYPREFRP